MICPNCGHEPKEGAAFCTKCGFRLDETVAGASNDSSAENVDDASAEEGEGSSPAGDAVGSANRTASVTSPSVNQTVSNTPNVPTSPVATPKKPSGKPIPRIVAALAAIAVCGILLVNVLIPLISPKPWCIGTWYCAGGTTSGIENLRFSDKTDTTLVIDADGTAKLHLGAANWTGSWEENEHDGGDYHSAVLRLSDDGKAPFIQFTLFCSNPNDKQSLAGLVTNGETDVILTFCRDKQAAQSSPWSRSDLPSPDSSSPSSSSHSSDSSSSREHSSSRSGGYSSSSSATLGQSNALESAQAYLHNVGGFSESGLRDQLEYEGFSSSEIDYAIEHCGANWNEQCAECAQDYLDSMSMSRSELYDQLEYEGFTSSQIAYGLAAVGY